MRVSLKQYFIDSFKDLKEAIINLALFFPYFFSVTTFSKTLFSPWKNLTAHKTQLGFTFSEWFDRFMFNFISRSMGFFMRSSMLVFYLFSQMLFLIFLPAILILAIPYILVSYIIYLSSPTAEEKKATLKAQFVKTHLIKEENRIKVEEWFENYYHQNYSRIKWWKLSNLYSYPPLGRDWAAGYTPNLDQFTTDLAGYEYQKYFQHIIGREKEIDQIERTLSKTEEANVVIVGEEGVGKHTVVDALAKRMYEGKTTPMLMYKRILKLNMEKVLTQKADPKEREQFAEELFAEAAAAKNVVLFIDNFEKYITSGPQSVDLTTAIEKYANTPNIQFIAITNTFSYEKYVATDPQLSQLFSKVNVYEVSKQEATEILIDTIAHYETRYDVGIPYETIIDCIEKSDFYITSIPFPEKAMQLLDSTCVYTVQTLKQTIVQPSYIDIVLTEKTHVPTSLDDTMKVKLIQLESLLNQRIIHQPQAVSEVASTLRRSFLLMGKRKKPLASFLFLGPTGVGKTETAKTVAQVFFGSEKYLIRFDMSAYQSQQDISHLIGSSETGNPGLMTQAIREQPYGVLLLDELEKANKELLNIFLTVLDEGYFTDGMGKRVDCKNLIIIATSNAGALELYKNNTAGSVHPELTSESLQQTIMNILIERRIFTPEFLNRFDGVIAFNPLNNTDVGVIAEKMLHNIIAQIYSLYKVNVTVSQDTLNNIVKNHYNPSFGARDIERILRKEVEDKIAQLILSNRAKEGDTIHL